MRWIEGVFWNGDERRLRAGWRLTIQLVLNLGLALVSLRLAAAWTGPVFSESPWFSLVGAALFLGATLLLVWLAGHFLDRRAFADFGLHPGRRSWWADLGAGLAVGSVVPTAAMLLASAVGWVELEWSPTSGMPGPPFLAAVLLSAVGYVCIGLFEETARAYHTRNLLEGIYLGVEVVSLFLLLGWVGLRHRQIGLQKGLATPALRARSRK